MPRFNFNEWREKYDKYTFEQHKKINNRFESLYPKQQKFVTKEVGKFLKGITKAKVLEVGGWKGELASQVLSTNKDIILWHNYDICSNAIDKNICKDERFKGIVLIDFVWNLNIFKEYNVCVLSHIIEHIKKKELIKFFSKIKHIKYIYIDAPLNDPYNRMKWKNYSGTHILECNWNDIKNILRNYKENIITNTTVEKWQSTSNPSCIRTYILKNS